MCTGTFDSAVGMVPVEGSTVASSHGDGGSRRLAVIRLGGLADGVLVVGAGEQEVGPGGGPGGDGDGDRTGRGGGGGEGAHGSGPAQQDVAGPLGRVGRQVVAGGGGPGGGGAGVLGGVGHGEGEPRRARRRRVAHRRFL